MRRHDPVAAVARAKRLSPRTQAELMPQANHDPPVGRREMVNRPRTIMRRDPRGRGISPDRGRSTGRRSTTRKKSPRAALCCEGEERTRKPNIAAPTHGLRPAFRGGFVAAANAPRSARRLSLCAERFCRAIPSKTRRRYQPPGHNTLYLLHLMSRNPRRPDQGPGTGRECHHRYQYPGRQAETAGKPIRRSGSLVRRVGKGAGAARSAGRSHQHGTPRPAAQNTHTSRYFRALFSRNISGRTTLRRWAVSQVDLQDFEQARNRASFRLLAFLTWRRDRVQSLAEVLMHMSPRIETYVGLCSIQVGRMIGTE